MKVLLSMDYVMAKGIIHKETLLILAAGSVVLDMGLVLWDIHKPVFMMDSLLMEKVIISRSTVLSRDLINV